MTKKYFIELAEYNGWANDTVCSWLEKITEEQWNRHIASSFSTIRETVVHMAGAENVWVERMKGVSVAPWLPDTFSGTKSDHIGLMKMTSDKLKEFVRTFHEDKLSEELFFKRLNGEENRMPYYQILSHVFNHSTYHRGQLVTMLREAGFTAVSSTDLSVFYKKKQE